MALPSRQEGRALLPDVRRDNPGLEENDQQLADILYEQTGDERFLPLARSSALSRGIDWVGERANEAGQAVEGFLGENIVGRAGNMITSSSPEVLINLAAARLPGVLPKLAGLAAGAAFSYGRTKGETGSEKAALGSAAGSLAGLAGGMAGQVAGRALAGPTASKAAQFVGGTLGSAAGSAPGDLLEIATQPGGVMEFLKDPLNLPAYALSSVGVGAGMDLAMEAASSQAKKVQEKKNAAADLSTLIEQSEADELANLRKLPSHQKTEIQLAREKELAGKLAEKDKALLKQKVEPKAPPAPADVIASFEVPGTLHAQMKQVAQGKKPVMQIPAGAEYPRVPDWSPGGEGVLAGYKSPIDGNDYRYDDKKVTPAMIDEAIKSNTLGMLLGYGTPSAPKNSDGRVAVLRSRTGIEKAAVVLGDGNEAAVREAMRKMSIGDDTFSIETPENVIAWREKNRGLKKLYSLSNEMGGQDDISFSNKVLDLLNSATKPKIRGMRVMGPRFTVDQEGRVGLKGLLKAVQEWAPAEIWEHYKERGIESLNRVTGAGETPLDFNKVSLVDFTKWLRENTPEVEVKMLRPDALEQIDFRAKAQHELEIQGFRIIDGELYEPAAYGNRPIMSGDQDRISKAYGKETAGLVYAYLNPELYVRRSDAATGSGYGVEPKPLDQMPGAVDILVRVPNITAEARAAGWTPQMVEKNPRTAEASRVFGSPLFRGPHFGQSDVNVLAFIRGYEETLPTGEKAFFIFEGTQSDWEQSFGVDSNNKTIAKWLDLNGQQRRRIFKTEKEARAFADQKKAEYAVKVMPLITRTDSLGLQAGIQYARSIGAKYIAISDAETAMMTEGHDRIYRNAGVIDTETGQPVTRPRQEKGMRAAYDVRLPAIAKRLTRDNGKWVDFGLNQKGESPVFNKKTNITARLYDISNPSPEVKKLFSLYDAAEQASFEQTLAAHSTDPDRVLTQREVLEKSIGGRYTDLDPLTNFLDAIKGVKGAIREQTMVEENRIASLDLQSRDIDLNRNISFAVKQAFQTLSHEMTHGAVEDLRKAEPEVYEYLATLIEEIGPVGRRAILDEIKGQYKLDNRFDPSYLSGEQFLPDDPHRIDKQTHEFVAGLMEAVASHHLSQNSTPEFLKFLPQPIARVLGKVIAKIKSFFSPDAPSITAMLDPTQAYRLERAVDIMQKHVIDVEQANLRATLGLKRSEVFSPETLFSTTFRRDLAAPLTRLDSKSGLRDVLGPIYDATLGWGESFFERNFMSALFRTRTHPWTKKFFQALHGFRPAVQTDEHGYAAYLGQLPDKSLSHQQALERWTSFVSSLTSGSSRSRFILKTYSDVFLENANRREKLINEGKKVTWDDMVNKKEMVDTYKLSTEEAEFLDRVARLPEVVMNAEHKRQENIDIHLTAKLFYRANKAQDLDGVVAKAARLTRVATDAGNPRLQMEYYKKHLSEEKRKADANPEIIADYEQRIAALQLQEDAFKAVLAAQIRQEFTGAINFKDNADGSNSFINHLVEGMIRMASFRHHERIITENVGYAPMTRRGRFILTVYKNDEEGMEFGAVKETRGFKTEQEARDYIEKEGLAEAQYKLLDKETLHSRAMAYSPDRLKVVAARAKQQLNEMVEAAAADSTLPAELRAPLIDLLNKWNDSFQPLSNEIRDVLSVRGDKFKERRYNVKGFDQEDFLPNIFEYMNYKTVAGNKRLTRAIAELQLERPELDNDPEMRARMQQELDYTLANQKEYTAFRKAIFYFYLGLSPRHLVQNAIQIPLNGISQMVAEGHGLKSYKYFGKGAALAAEYNLKGTTGDAFIDSALKQAEKDGISFQIALENPIHESVELQSALDGWNAHNEGLGLLGQRAKYAATEAWKRFEKVLQSTSTAAEAANRKTTFIASILAERARGVKDPAQLYAKASEFTNYVNFVGDKPNRPGVIIGLGNQAGKPLSGKLHGPVVTMMALQSFTINHLSQLYSFWKNTKSGSKLDKQALMVGVANLLAFSGAMGFVGATTAEAFFERMFGISLKTAARRKLIESLPFESETADRIADGFFHGLPAFAGVDMSGSIGLGSPLFRYEAGQPVTLEQLGGAGVGMLGRVAQAAGEVLDDPFNPHQRLTAMRTLSPSFLTQATKVYDLLNRGTVLDSKQQPITDSVGITGSAAILGGFNPMEVTKQRAFNNADYKAKKKASEEYQRHSLNIARSLHSFNTQGNPDDLLAAQTMFADYLDSVAGLQDRQEFIDSISAQLREIEAPVVKPPTLKGAPARRELEAAYPTVERPSSDELSSLLRSLGVAQSLGQEDLLVKKLKTLPSSALDAMISDLLVQGGLQPELAGYLQQPSRVERLGPSATRRAGQPR